MFSEYKGIPSQAMLLVYLSLIPNVAIGFIYTDLAYLLPNVKGLDPTLAGVVGSVMGVTLVAESIPMGIVADRFGRRKMLILGNVCASLSLIGFALASSFPQFVVIAFLEGTGEAAAAVSVSALLAEKAGDQKRTSAFSLLAFSGWIAGAAGAFIISSVLPLQNVGLSVEGAHVVLYVVVGLLNLSITPFMFKIGESETHRETRAILPRKSAGVIKKFFVYSVLIAVGAGLFVPIMSFWFFKAYGVSDAVSGPVLGLTNLLTAFVVFMSPRLANKWGLVRATVITQASSTVFMLAIPSSPSFGVAASIYLVRVFLMNLSNPLTQSLVMGLVVPEERGRASGIAASIWRLPNTLSQIVGFTLIGAGLLALPFYIATVLYVIGIGLFWFLFKDARLPEESERFRSQPPVQSSSLEGPDPPR